MRVATPNLGQQRGAAFSEEHRLVVHQPQNQKANQLSARIKLRSARRTNREKTLQAVDRFWNE